MSHDKNKNPDGNRASISYFGIPMSDNNAFFDDKKKEVAIRWLNRCLPNLKCECCGEGKWILSDNIVTMPNYTGGIVLGGNILPHIPLICSNCGNTKFFNAITMGVIKKGEDTNG